MMKGLCARTGSRNRIGQSSGHPRLEATPADQVRSTATHTGQLIIVNQVTGRADPVPADEVAAAMDDRQRRIGKHTAAEVRNE